MNQKRELINIRLKLYLILVLASLMLLFYSIGHIGFIIVKPTNLFGLASQLPFLYWVGLALILICSIFLFIDKGNNNDLLLIAVLIVLSLFFFGIVIFCEQCPRDCGSYYPSATALTLTETHHVNTSDTTTLYNSWPTIQLLTASVLEITRIALIEFIRYFPLYWAFCFICITYSIGKHLNLPKKLPFLLSLFALSSFYMLWSSYDPPSLAILLYLLCFMFIITPRNIACENILLALIFSGLIITHSITSVAVLLSFIILSVFKKRYNLIALFVILFASWYMFQSLEMFKQGITNWLSAPWKQLFLVAQQVERTTGIAPPQRVIYRDFQLIYWGLFGIGAIASTFISWKNKEMEKDNKLIIACLLWLFGILGITLAVPSGTSLTTDILGRIYLYGSIPLCVIVVFGLHYQKLMIILIILFVSLNIPTHYAAEAAYGQIYPMELLGAQFFAIRVKPYESYFYNGSDIAKLVYFYNPSLASLLLFSPEQSFISPDKVNPEIMEKVTYVVMGSQGINRMIWAYGNDPLEAWLKSEDGEAFVPIYDNGEYQIYKNNNVGY